MFTIAIIDINGDEVTDDDYNILCNKMLNMKNMIKDNIDKYVTIISVASPQEMMIKVIEILDMTSSLLGMTTTCYEDSDYIYQLIHIHVEQINNDSKLKLNVLASMISYNKINIYGKAVLIRSLMRDNEIFIPSDISYDNIKYVLDKRIPHKGIYLTTQYEERNFIIDPTECCNEFAIDTERTLNTFTINFANFMLVMLYDCNATEQTNIIASQIAGGLIKGNVFIFIKHGDCDYINLDIELFTKFKILLDQGKREMLLEKISCKYLISQYKKLHDYIKI